MRKKITTQSGCLFIGRNKIHRLIDEVMNEGFYKGGFLKIKCCKFI